MEVLETAVSLLQATGGSLVAQLDVGDKLLGDYIANVLMLSSKELGSAAVSSKVALKNINSLWKLLRDFSVLDPFAGVRPKYRQVLDQDHFDSLKQALKIRLGEERLDCRILVPLLKEFIISQLGEDHIGAKKSIKGTIGYKLAKQKFSSLSLRAFVCVRACVCVCVRVCVIGFWKWTTCTCQICLGSRALFLKKST